MYLLKPVFVTIFVHFFTSTCVFCKRHDVHEMMYKTFEGAPACFRRLNGTHQFGCSSPRGGSYGVVHFIKNETDLTDFLHNAVASPYAIILTPILFRRDVIDSLISSSKVSGIILNTAQMPEVEPAPQSFSPDDSCPNRYTSIGNSCSVDWNPGANRFLFHDWPLPVFLINNLTHYKSIADCHDKFNPPLDESQLSRPLCSLHLDSHMYAAVNSETCLRRINYYGVNTAKYCDPLGDENIVLPSLPWAENGSKNVIIVGARMDALSMFDGVAPGAMSAATGLASLITTAFVFHKMISMHDYKQNDVGVLFIIFNGEANDYIGSSRIVYDMKKGLFPSRNNKLSMNNVQLFLELSQLSSSKKVFVHHTSDKEVTEFINYLNDTTIDVKFESSHVNELPPVSLQSFYKEDKNIGGAVLSNFDNKFVNTYFSSIFDTSKYLNYVYANGSFINESSTYDLQNRLAGISNTLASFLFKKAFNKEPPKVDQQQSVVKVDELLHCYIETRKCRLMKEVGYAVEGDKEPDLLPLYVGVKNPKNYVARVTGFILAYLTGKKLKISRENCINNEDNPKDYAYFWMNGETGNGECINSSILFTPAESPAFIIEGYDWKSSQYSTWTESVWHTSNLGMFVKPFRIQEIIVLCTGLLVLTMSFTTVFWFNKKADILFMPVSPTSC